MPEYKSHNVPEDLYKPIGTMVAVEVLKLDTHSKITLPDTVQNDWDTPVCKVLATGPKCEIIKPGDLVLCFNNTQAQRVRFAGFEMIAAPEEMFIGVVNPSMKEEILKRALGHGELATNLIH